MIVRKILEVFRFIYRIFCLPFIKIFYEVKTDSIIKQRTFLYGTLVLEGKNFIGMASNLFNVEIGFGSYIAEQCNLINVKIGKFCSIGSNVKIIAGRHPIHDYVSTSPCFYSNVSPNKLFFIKKEGKFDEYKYADSGKKFYVEIGNDVWIGNNACIMDGVRIGDGAVIGANSLVTKNVQPYSIVVGNPAKIIKYRFSSDQIDELTKVKWWDKNLEWLHENAESFSDIDIFLNKIRSVNN